MAQRLPLVLISGAVSELPTGDFILGDAANAIVAGSGVIGGGASFRLDVSLSENPSGLVFNGTGDSATLGNDGSAIASGNAALSALTAKLDKFGDVMSNTLVVNGQSYGTISQTVQNGTIVLDLSNNSNFDLTLDGNSTLSNPVNASGGQSGAITLRQDSFGFRTLAYNNAWKFQQGLTPALTSSASGVDVLTYYVSSPGEIQSQLLSNLSN